MDFVGFSWIFPLIFRHWPSVCHDCLRETITVWASKDSTIYIVDETSPFRLPNLPKIKGNYCLDLLSMVPIDAIHKGVLDLQMSQESGWTFWPWPGGFAATRPGDPTSQFSGEGRRRTSIGALGLDPAGFRKTKMVKIWLKDGLFRRFWNQPSNLFGVRLDSVLC